MTKTFCDLCEKPATKHMLEARTEQAFGERHSTSYGTKLTRTKVTLSVSFGIRDHSTGFGGPPDLCADCANKLLAKLKVTP